MPGHGISEERIERAFEIGNKWFELPLEEKEKYKLDLVECTPCLQRQLLPNEFIFMDIGCKVVVYLLQPAGLSPTN